MGQRRGTLENLAVSVVDNLSASSNTTLNAPSPNNSLGTNLSTSPSTKPRTNPSTNLSTDLGINAAAWKGRRVFITGHTGFKGGWLSLWLSSLGANVTGYALKPDTEPNFFSVAKIGEHTKSIIADIRDYPTLLSAMQKAQPEVIFHLAAQALVRRSYADPRETYETNVMGTVNVLEAARHIPSVHAVVIVTSDKCYDNKESPGSSNAASAAFIETDPMGGHDPYSNSKGCAELVTSAFRDSYFSSDSANAKVLVASARAGNVIGGGDWSEDRLIPDLLRAFTNNKAAVVRNPNAIRPWQHVMEPLSGYIMLAERLLNQDRRCGSAWNFGPSDTESIPVAKIADQLCALWGNSATWTQDSASASGEATGTTATTAEQPHEAHFLALNSGKARSQLGWQAVLPLNATLQLVVDWQNAFLRGEDLRGATLGQIDTYSQLRSRLSHPPG